MTHKDKKFAYRHKPTKKWVYLNNYKGTFYVNFLHEFHPDCCFAAKNVIEEILETAKEIPTAAKMGSESEKVRLKDYELIEIQVEHKTKKKSK